MTAKTTATRKTTATAAKGISNTPAPTGPVVPANLAGVVTAPATPAPAKTAKTTATKTAAKPTSAGAKAVKAIEFLTKNAGTGYAVKDIEAGVGYGDKTLAGVLGRLATQADSGIQRADVPLGGRIYKGFRYVTPKKTTTAK